MAGRFKVEAVFKAVDKITAPVTKMSNKIGIMTRTASRGISRLDSRMTKFGQGARKAFGYIAIGAGTASLALTDVISTGMNFDQAITDTAARLELLDKGTQAYKDLSEAAREAGRSTEFTSTQAALSERTMAKAGFEARDIIQSLPHMIDFATASGEDLFEATSMAVDAMASFGKLRDGQNRVEGLIKTVNLLNRAANDANQTVYDIREGLKQGAPIAIGAGQDMETVAAFTKVLADSGIKGSVQSTAIKRLTTGLAAQTPEAAKILRRLRVDAFNADGTVRDFTDTFIDLSNALKDKPNAIPYFDAIFGKIPIASAIQIVNSAEGLKTYRDTLYDIDGTTKNMADYMRNTLRGRFKMLVSAIESVKISTTELNKGGLGDTIDLMTEWVRNNESLIASKLNDFLTAIIDNFKDIVIWLKRIAIIAGVFLTISLGVKALTLSLAALEIAVWAVNLAMSANPLVLIVAAILLVIATIALFVIKWEELMDVWNKLTPFGKGLAMLLLGPLKVILLLAAAVRMVVDNLEELKEKLTDTEMFKTLKWVGSKITDGVSDIANLIPDVWEDKPQDNPQVITQAERTGRVIEENNSTNYVEMVLKAASGTSAEVVGDKLPMFMKLEQSGEF